MRFFLTGFMGCGKSFWGQQLSLLYHLPFIDLDTYIEEAENCSLEILFAEKGETFFRALEKKYLRKAIDESNHFIMATGGGTACFFDNMQYMNEQGMTFYLKANADQLLRNIQQDESKRPLLQNLKDDALLDYIETKLKEREHYYEMAQHIVTVNSDALSIFDAKIKQYV